MRPRALSHIRAGKATKAKRAQNQRDNTCILPSSTYSIHPFIFCPPHVRPHAHVQNVFFWKKKRGERGEERGESGGKGQCYVLCMRCYVCVCTRGELTRLRRQGKALNPKASAPATKITRVVLLLLLSQTKEKR